MVEHSLTEGGKITYDMTGPDGEKFPGWMEITAVYRSTYESVDALQTVLDMGVEEGSTQAINQIDDLLAR